MYYAPFTFVVLPLPPDEFPALLQDSAYCLLWKDSFLDPYPSGLRDTALLYGHTAPSSYLCQSTFHTVCISQLNRCSTSSSLRSEASIRGKVRGSLESERPKMKSSLSHMLCNLDKLLNFSETQLLHL